jgi:hypothetical protein
LVAIVATIKTKAPVLSNHTMRISDFSNLHIFDEPENLHDVDYLDNMLLAEMEEALGWGGILRWRRQLKGMGRWALLG